MSPRQVALKRSTRRIRLTIAATMSAMFIALFAVIYVQMAMGNDPVLAAARNHATLASTKPVGAGASETATAVATAAPTVAATAAPTTAVTTQQS
jgi:hypothetical protein